MRQEAWARSRPSSLEYGTKLVGVSQGFWGVGLYPEAAEAIAIFHSSGRSGRAGASGDPEDARQVAVRRARTGVRRYCAANRLNRLGTLTYGPPFCREPGQLRDHVGSFFRRLRRELGGEPFPYLWTAELHSDGSRLHAHFGVGRFVPYRVIRRSWPHGIVDIRLLGDLPYGATALDEARLAARYLSKYVGKAFGEGDQGRHRYEVAQGFGPRRVGARADSRDEVVAWAAEQMGRPADFTKPSDEWGAYHGPPAVFMSWT